MTSDKATALALGAPEGASVDRRAEPEGLTLQEAAERYTDPAKWQELNRLDTLIVGRRRNRIIDRSLRWRDQLEEEQDEARAVNRLFDQKEAIGRELTRELLEKLYRGELIATGMALPLSFESKRRCLPRDWWHFLSPYFESSYAKGGGVEVGNVRIFSAEEWARLDGAQDVNNAHQPTKPARREVPSVTGHRSSRRGRPRAIDFALQILEEHAHAGTLKGNWKAECHAIIDDARQRATDQPVPAYSTVHRQVGAKYRALRNAQLRRNSQNSESANS